MFPGFSEYRHALRQKNAPRVLDVPRGLDVCFKACSVYFARELLLRLLQMPAPTAPHPRLIPQRRSRPRQRHPLPRGCSTPLCCFAEYERRPHEHAHTDACVISFFVGPASAQRVAPHLTQNFLSAESLSPHLGQIFLPVTRLTDTSDLGCDLNRFIISSKSGSPLSSFAD